MRLRVPPPAWLNKDVLQLVVRGFCARLVTCDSYSNPKDNYKPAAYLRNLISTEAMAEITKICRYNLVKIGSVFMCTAVSRRPAELENVGWAIHAAMDGQYCLYLLPVQKSPCKMAITRAGGRQLQAVVYFTSGDKFL